MPILVNAQANISLETVAAMALVQKLLHLTNFSSPFLRTVVPSVSAAFAIQAAFAVPSILAETERFYDFSGALTNISIVALSLYLPALRAKYAGGAAAAAGKALPSLLTPFTNPAAAGLNWRQVALTGFVTLWAARCMCNVSPTMPWDRSAYHIPMLTSCT